MKRARDAQQLADEVIERLAKVGQQVWRRAWMISLGGNGMPADHQHLGRVWLRRIILVPMRTMSSRMIRAQAAREDEPTAGVVGKSRFKGEADAQGWGV